jgi:hypothetical protein
MAIKPNIHNSPFSGKIQSFSKTPFLRLWICKRFLKMLPTAMAIKPNIHNSPFSGKIQSFPKNSFFKALDL